MSPVVASVAAVAIVATWQALRLRRTLRTLRAGGASAPAGLDGIVQASWDAVLLIDREGRIVDLNPQAEGLLGYSREEIVARPFAAIVAEVYRPRYARHRARFLEAGARAGVATALELTAVRADGAEVAVELSLTPAGDQGLIAAALRDVSDRRHAAEVSGRLAAIVEHTDDAVLSVTPDGRIASWNGGADRLYGHRAAAALGMPLDRLVADEHSDQDRQHLARTMANGEVRRYDSVHVTSEGARIDVGVMLSPIHDPTGAVSAVSVIVRDFTDRKRVEGRLRYLADHDALTGLFNRRRFEEDLDRELARARRERRPGALLSIDLDNFKEVNDSLGHAAGDKLIKATAELLRSRLRTTDVLARLGGDEFAAMLPATAPESAELVAAELLQALRTDARSGLLPAGRAVTASVGIVTFDGDAEVTAAELLADADIAMYDAKEHGRDRSVMRRGVARERIGQRTTWPDRIRQALRDGRLVLMAQPIVPLAGARPPRHELLVRMLSETGELIPPGVFLHAAERHELIREIDRWVLTEAIATLAREQHAGREVRLGVNLSARSVADPELPAIVGRMLDAAGADGRGLCLEVRESTAILNVERSRALVAGVHALGCTLAVDDFGAGFASFYYLKHLAFDAVKIDSEFIAQLRENTTNQLVVRSIVDIARGLGRETIAECVGDARTVELLRRLGVDYAQGFCLGPPVLLADADLTAGALRAAA